MTAQELRMLAFALLAAESRKRQQPYGELRFLLLAGSAACRAGWADVPRRCRERVLEISPHHRLANYDSLEDALRDEEFRTFLSRLDRFCSFEMAEALLEKLHPGWQSIDFAAVGDLGSYCLNLLKNRSEV
jgi:hypothetical protein